MQVSFIVIAFQVLGRNTHVRFAVSLSEKLDSRPESRKKGWRSTDETLCGQEAVRQLWKTYKVELSNETGDNFLSTIKHLEREERRSDAVSNTDTSPTQYSDEEIVLPKTTTKSKPQIAVQATPVSESQELWNAAFQSIEETPEGKELAQKYLKILGTTLGDAGNNVCLADNSAAESDEPDAATIRQRDMINLVRTGLKKVEKSTKITNTMAAFAEAVLAAKPLADFVIQIVPHAAPAALPWAGVCAGLQVSTNETTHAPSWPH